MGKHAKTAAWMAMFSAITLLLGVIRELVIAHDLRSTGAADEFFRGLVVVASARQFALALFRARFIPVGHSIGAFVLLRGEAPTLLLTSAVAVVAVAGVMSGDNWQRPTPWIFIVATILATAGSGVRALAERAGHERAGFIVEWAVPVGTVVGAVAIGRGALGPTVGLAIGLAVGSVVLAAVSLQTSSMSTRVHTPARWRTRYLILDTLAYVNLGLFDAALSSQLFESGQYATLHYGYLFVNATLAVPTAAATVVGLRKSAKPSPATPLELRRWALGIGLAIAGLVILVGITLRMNFVQWFVDDLVGWSMSAEISALILVSAPFAGLRIANTIGRQFRVAHDPRGLLKWDALGLGLRGALLVGGAATLGIIASPIALAAAEVCQLPAWVGFAGQRNKYGARYDRTGTDDERRT